MVHTLTVEPVSIPSIPVEDTGMDTPARGYFERLAFLIGLGGAACLGYIIFKHLQSNATTSAQKALPQLRDEIKLNNEDAGKPKAEVKDDRDAQNLVEETNNNNNIEGPKPQLTKVVLHQCPRGYYTPCIAPFPLKLETLLRVAGIPYEVDFSVSPDDGNVPWMTIGDQEIHESHECITKLSDEFRINLDSKAQHSRLIACRLVSIMLDSHIYWGIALWRWVYNEGNSVPQIQPLSTAGLATLEDIGASVKRAAYYHGLGRLSPAKVIDLILNDLGDLSSALGKHQFFMGEHPGEVDCAAFAMLAQMIWNMPGSPFEPAVKQYRNLIDFVLRMRDNFWPDWQSLLQVRGQENLDGPSISPGSEFLHKRLRNSGSSQWDSRSGSTVTLKDEEEARNAEARVRPQKSSHHGILKTSRSHDDNNSPGLQKIPQTPPNCQNPFEETGENFPPAHVQNIPAGMIRPRNGPLTVSYADPNQQFYQPNSQAYTHEPVQSSFSHHRMEPNMPESMKNPANGRQGTPPLPSHGNVIQRITQQNGNQRIGSNQKQNLHPNTNAPELQLQNSPSGVGIYSGHQYQMTNFNGPQRGNAEGFQHSQEIVYRDDFNQPVNYYVPVQPQLQSNQFYQQNHALSPPQFMIRQAQQSKPYPQNNIPSNFREYPPQ